MTLGLDVWVKVVTRVLTSMPASQASLPSYKMEFPRIPHPCLSLYRPMAKAPTSVSPMAASLPLHFWDQGLEVSVHGTQPLPRHLHGVPGAWSVNSKHFLGCSPGAEGAGGCGGLDPPIPVSGG